MTAETIRSADWWQTELPHCVKIKSQKESAESHLFWYWTQSPSHQWIFKQIDKKANPFTTTFTHSPGHTQVTKHSSLKLRTRRSTRDVSTDFARYWNQSDECSWWLADISAADRGSPVVAKIFSASIRCRPAAKINSTVLWKMNRKRLAARSLAAHKRSWYLLKRSWTGCGRLKETERNICFIRPKARL